MKRTFSLILLPTLRCDADCEYCFENKSGDQLTLARLSLIIDKVLDYTERKQIETLSIYWQGGEVMTLGPSWFEEAHMILQQVAETRNCHIVNYLQSNMLAYDSQWNSVLSEMFGNSIGSSMDFPNLYRRVRGGGAEEYSAVWSRKISEAKGAGMEVGVIAIPNEKTLEEGAERFYSYFVNGLGITNFQINTPFPGGTPNDVKRNFPLKNDDLAQFYSDLAKVWMDRGYTRGVRIGPFDRLLDYFITGHKDLPCTWNDNCVSDFICIDPRGYVSQCDCWAVSYPEFRFGNIFESDSLDDLLRTSEARKSLHSRPGLLIQEEDCIECEYLTLCHGGCPIRTYTVHRTLFRKDPYCPLYRSLFKEMEESAAQTAQRN